MVQREMKSRRVFWLLVLVAAATVLYRGEGIYQYIRCFPNWENMQGFYSQDVRDGHLFVQTVTDSDLSGNPSPARLGGLRAGDLILAVYTSHGEGTEVHSYNDYIDTLTKMKFGEPWHLDVGRKNSAGSLETLHLTIPAVYANSFSGRSWLISVFSQFIVPLLAIGVALFIGFYRPDDRNAVLASLIFFSFSYISGVRIYLFPPVIKEIAIVVAMVMSIFMFYWMMLFFLSFPSPSLIQKKFPWLGKLFLGLLLVYMAISMVQSYFFYTSFTQYEALKNMAPRTSKYIDYLTLFPLIIGLVSLAINTFRAETKDDRRRLAILLTGSLVGLLPAVAFFLYMILTGRYPAWWMIAGVLLTLLCFPLSFIYAIVKHRVFGIRFIIRRGLYYALLSRGFRVVEGVILFTLFYVISRSLFIRFIHYHGPVAIALYTACVTALVVAWLPKINRPFMSALDRRFFRDHYNAQQVLTDLSRGVRRLAAEPDRLLEMVTAKISDSLYPDQVAVFLRETRPNQVSSAEHAVTTWDSGSQDAFRCHRRQLRSGTRVDPLLETQHSEFVLSETSFVSKYLAKTVSHEPEALEVYLDNPRSWVSALARVTPQDQIYRERKILEELNTRLIVPLTTGDRVLGFISLGEKLSEEPYTKEDKELLLTVAEQTTIALDYAQLIGQVAEQEKMKREIEIAKQVQAQLFPQTVPEMRTLDYVGICQAARGVGGDYYDFIALGSDRVGIALGDISGKGISAALLMASLQALLRSNASLHGDNVAALIGDINRLMHRSTASGKYATFFYGLYDDANLCLTYVNAGHLPPLLFRPHSHRSNEVPVPPPSGDSGSYRPLHSANCRILRLKTGGTVLGIFPEVQYRQECVRMLPGDVLLIYSDGVSEAMNSQEEEYGEQRLSDLVAENLHRDAADLRDLVLSRLSDHVGQVPQHDDLTLVVIKVEEATASTVTSSVQSASDVAI